jgi:hypothetical protein
MRDQARESASGTYEGITGDAMGDLFARIAVLLRSEFKAGAVSMREHCKRDGIATKETRADCEFDIAQAERVGFRRCRRRSVCFAWAAKPVETHYREIPCGAIERGRVRIQAELLKDCQGHRLDAFGWRIILGKSFKQAC